MQMTVVHFVILRSVDVMTNWRRIQTEKWWWAEAQRPWQIARVWHGNCEQERESVLPVNQVAQRLVRLRSMLSDFIQVDSTRQDSTAARRTMAAKAILAKWGQMFTS